MKQHKCIRPIFKKMNIVICFGHFLQRFDWSKWNNQNQWFWNKPNLGRGAIDLYEFCRNCGLDGTGSHPKWTLQRKGKQQWLAFFIAPSRSGHLKPLNLQLKTWLLIYIETIFEFTWHCSTHSNNPLDFKITKLSSYSSLDGTK